MLPYVPFIKAVPNSLDESVTKNEELLKLLETNPIVNEQPLSLITSYNLLQMANKVETNAKELNIPLFICHGEADVVTDCNSSKCFYDVCGVHKAYKILKIYKGKGHLLFNEEPLVITDSMQWMMNLINT
eukprot:6219_1